VLNGWKIESIHNKRVELFAPNKPRHCLLYLHPVGRETLCEDAIFTDLLTQLGFACCVPHGERSWWSNQVCPEFDDTITTEQFLLHDVVPFMKQLWPGMPLAVAGISMGGQGAIRLGFKYPDLFPVVAGIASAFDYHEWYGNGTPIDVMYPNRERCRLDTAILHLNPIKFPPQIWFACDPTDDEWYRGNDRLVEKLTAYGVPHTADLATEAGGHTWEYFHAQAEPMIRFLSEALQTQSRRLM
jgi:S-formylglutathione hydrolase